MQVGGVYRPNFLKLSSGYKKNFKLNGEEARHFLQLDPYCGPSASNFGRADFDGDGQEDEIGWYVMGDDKLVQLSRGYKKREVSKDRRKVETFFNGKTLFVGPGIRLGEERKYFQPMGRP